MVRKVPSASGANGSVRIAGVPATVASALFSLPPWMGLKGKGFRQNRTGRPVPNPHHWFKTRGTCCGEFRASEDDVAARSRQCNLADRAFAAFTVFSIRQAIVIGPTPRGTGVMAPATCTASSKATSPRTS